MVIEVKKQSEKDSQALARMTIQLKEQFLIPGIIGDDKNENAYTDIKEFVTELHEYKDSSIESLIKIMDSKLDGFKKKSEKDAE